MHAKAWTKEDTDYLQDNWGTVSLPGIANKLKRTNDAVRIRVFRLKLGPFLECGDYITFNQLILALGIPGANGYKNISWIENRSFPVKNKKCGDKTFKIVYLKDFWKWAEKNRDFVNYAKMEKNILGLEPSWLDDQRRADIEKSKYKLTPWTESEDRQLENLLKTFKYGYLELSKKLRRTDGAIQRRIIYLGLKERPLKSESKWWTSEEINQLKSIILSGTSYSVMAEKLNRSSKAIRGKVYGMYKSENLDKVRIKMLEEEVIICHS